MLTRSAKPACVLALAGALALALSGCTAGENFSAIESYAGAPKDITIPAYVDQSEPYARWSTDGKSFAVTLVGSADCAPTVESMAVSASAKGMGQLTLATNTNGAATCPAEGVAHTTILSAPAEWQENESDWALVMPDTGEKIILSRGGGN